MRRNDFFKSLLFSGGSAASRVELKTETLPYTFNSNSYKLRNYLRNYRIYGNTVNEESVGDLVTEGEHSGEYMVPVTVSNGTDTQTIPIYLTKQIRKVGDEAEYVDYKEQKQHRVRKNLFDENYPDIGSSNKFKSIYVGDGKFTLSTNYPLTSGSTAIYLLSGEISDGVSPTAALNGAWNEHNKTIISENGYVTIVYRILNTINPCNYWVMLNSGSTALPYEPYIENTELDVTLPALPTLSGTNTLSVGTTVQPSKVYLQGKISEAEIVSARSLQTNMQSLQPLSLDDEDLELDVMPTDNDLQIDIKPIEKPVLNLNNVSEIENAEIERGVESAE